MTTPLLLGAILLCLLAGAAVAWRAWQAFQAPALSLLSRLVIALEHLDAIETAENEQRAKLHAVLRSGQGRTLLRERLAERLKAAP